MNVLTACSGIGAPEHAWRDLPFNFIGCSEIEPFPSAVLKHHYPNVTNYGDMNNYRDWKIDEPITALFAGTPCQSFSVAGLRQGMDSPNGNLALVYLGMVERFAPRWVIWENVPGVLSSNGGRDFGSFLGALGQLRYSYAYRVLDAQFFGVPQRRRRVFLVGHRGNWRYPAAILFEPKSMRGNTSKSGKAGEDIAPTVVCGPPYSRTENQRVEAEALILTNDKEWPVKIGSTLDVAYATKLGLEDQHAFRGKLFWQQNERARRIMPLEAERLQGFPDNYTDIIYRGKPAPDSQRYKALGNSMAVPVVRWIGKRIAEVEKANA